MIQALWNELLGINGEGFIGDMKKEVESIKREVRDVKNEWHKFLQTREETCPFKRRTVGRRALWIAVSAVIISAITAGTTLAMVL
jgi:hypothetical protein